MKRVMITTLFCFLFLVVSSVTAFLLRYANNIGIGAMFGIASGILVLGILLHVLLRKKNKLKLIPFFVNAVSMGAYLRSWYIFRGFDNALWLIVLTAALASAVILVFALFLLIPKIREHYGIFLLVFVLLLLATYILLVIFTQNTWVSTLGFYGIVALSFVLGLSIGANAETFPFSSLVWSSYSIAICAIIIAVIVLSEGDGLDGVADLFCVGDVSGSAKSKKRRKPK